MARQLAGIGLSALCVVLLFWLIDFSRAIDVLREANPLWIGAAVAFLLASLAAKSFRWANLLPAHASVSSWRLYRLMHVSHLLNNLLPFRLGDLARLAATSREPGLRTGHVISSMVTERLADIGTLTVAFLAVSLFLPLPGAYQPWVATAWIAVASLAITFASIAAVRSGGRWSAPGWWLAVIGVSASRLPAPIRRELNHFGDGFSLLFAPSSFRAVWAWSLAAWLSAFAVNYCLMHGLGIGAPWTVAIVITCTTNLVMLVPSSPGYVGVFHAAATLSLLPFGIDSDVALAFALVAHLVNVLPPSILGAIFLAFERDMLSRPRNSGMDPQTTPRTAG